MEKKTKNKEVNSEPVHLTVDGCSVKLNFLLKSEKRVIEDVKHMILNSLAKVQK